MGLFNRKREQPPPTPPPAPPTLQEQIRENKRAIDRSCRELDRERSKLEQQEKQLQMQIRKVAREGQMDSARVMARDLVKTRASVTKMYQIRTQMQSVSMQMTSMKTTQQVASSMSTVVTSMTQINAEFSVPSMQKVLLQYEKENGRMGMTQELMEDAVDEAVESRPGEEDEVINSVMDELGLEAGTRLGTTGPTGNGAPAVQTSADEAHDTAQLEQQLEALRRK